jgi:nitrous oxidase accessory protein
MFSNHNSYTGNRFETNGAGVAVMFSRNIRMTSNEFINNWGTASYGLLLKEIYDGEITDNLFANNTTGIYAESANRLKIHNNDLKGNGWALKILGSCMDNTFTGNNFFTNTFDLTINSAEDHNTYTGNYWSSYTGYDLDRNGFGDIPHRPVSMFSYLVGKVDVSILLLRSLFIDILNFAEKVTPLFVPRSLVDPEPLMSPRL